MHPPAALAWSVWALGASLYLAGFFQRVAPAVMTQELMADFGIAAAGLGQLSAFYFYSYVAIQVPTGLAVDRYGPRRVLAGGALVAMLGALAFAMAPTFGIAALGRLAIGGAVGVAFVATLKLAAHWFAPRRFALASGLTLACGVIGAVGAGAPLRAAISAFGWRPVMLASAAAIALVFVAIILIVRNDPADRGYRSHFAGARRSGASGSVWRGLGEVLAYRNTWLILAAPQGIAGATIAFGGLWGVPYIVAVYGTTRETAALVCSLLMVAWAVGGPLFGALSDRVGRRKPLYLAGAVASLVLWSAVVFVPRLPLAALIGLLLACGLCAGAMVIGFAFGKESVPARLAGTATGVINMGAMIGPMVMQPAIGWMLDRKWNGAVVAGVRVYDADAYRAGFALMLAWLAVSVLVLAFARETHARQAP